MSFIKKYLRTFFVKTNFLQNQFILKNRLKYKAKNKGFTLIEILVSMIISGIVMASAMGIYWVLLKSHQQNAVYREMLRQTTFAMTKITDQIRNQGIDYSSYNITECLDSAIPASNIDNHINADNELILYLNNIDFVTTGRDGSSFKNILIKDGAKTSPLFSDNFEIESLNISITPSCPPNSNLYETEHQLQPKVHISMKVRSNYDHSLNFSLQTTVSSRNYQF